eukprot:scaffold35457_cov367-Amphora_coffeaeformis.AAC.1
MPPSHINGNNKHDRQPLPQAVTTSDNNNSYDESNDDNDDLLVDPLHGATGGTVAAAIFGIIKAMVGPAILYLPRSFANAGYLFALVALAVTLAMYLYASSTLLA